MRSALAWAVALGLLVVAGCGGDSTGPGSGDGVAGTWDFSIHNLGNGTGVNCNGPAMTMQLQGSGSSFSGTYNGVITCGGASGGPTFPSSGTIMHGVLSGSGVSFDLDESSAHHVGTLSGNTMSGSETYHLSGNLTLTGTWSATRR
jgi:hypothetical protein